MTNKIMAYAYRLGNQRHLCAIRDGFVAMMPLLVLGSMVTLINTIPGIINSMFHTEWAWPEWLRTINGNVWWGTFDMIGLIAVFSIAYSLAKYYEADGLAAGIVSVATYLSIVPQSIVAVAEDGTEVGAWGNINRAFTNAQGLFVGIIVALLATEIFVRLKKSGKLEIKMPDGVPPAVGRSFAALFPGFITIIGLVTFFVFLEKLSGSNIFTLIKNFVSAPLLNVADSLGYALLVVLFTHVMWFFGLHGSNILEGIIQPISLQMMDANMTAFANNQPVPHIVTKPFLDTFVYIGGAGAVLGLLLSIFLICRSKQYRMVANLSIAPNVFNINEPVIFGLPIVLNPILFVPFVIGPMIITTVSYFATAIGFVPRVIAIIPWSTPPIISGLLATGGAWQAVVLQLINIFISIVIYLPFIKAADRAEIKKELAAEEGK